VGSEMCIRDSPSDYRRRVRVELDGIDFESEFHF